MADMGVEPRIELLIPTIGEGGLITEGMDMVAVEFGIRELRSRADEGIIRPLNGDGWLFEPREKTRGNIGAEGMCRGRKTKFVVLD